jgi:hypothetical protein
VIVRMRYSRVLTGQTRMSRSNIPP